ncbi:MAG: electron transfer flavoprotein subunit beta/FixA family protein [Gemmatimonadota bacterium]|jgi:electron transfer flavoprotein beta subunit|nr:electron transfer flavoprotein subunit beta/FixA family protein [Gemmatimonadota bacterium]MDP6529908.1 electron transfer flavoprotein subunit beta/FixA family protein [Gemmatimonadota bacterium]MDP6802145.1 electron transfer flavoprotein subunit beta/FixA family protein [Gemmatimonadota bacterium]MDP7032080.1 electron transfer flavoprotein subunit beta/FixA family protein [Gemmatimonadota bacterium]
MKSVVLIKQVPEAPSIRGEAGGAGSVESDSKSVTNPYDHFAIEEGLKTRESHGGEVTALTLGPETAVESLREALAMGANHAVHLKDDAFEGLDASGAAAVLAAGVEKVGEVDLVFVGRQTIDTNTALTGPMVAQRLGMTLLTEVFRVDEIDQEAGTICVERLLEGGLQVVKGRLPALLAMTKDSNEPRFASILGIRKASRAPVTEWGAGDLGVEAASRTQVTGMSIPPARPGGELLQGEPEELAETLVARLAEAKLI